MDDEAAMAAIQAAAEAAAALEATDLQAEPASEGDVEATTDALAEVESDRCCSARRPGGSAAG